jgi:hypothetical protein
MHLQSVEFPSEGTAPLAATSHPSFARRHLSQYSTTSRGFGRSSCQVELLYPVRYPDKEKAEEERVAELEAPLKEKDEGAHLTQQLQTPPDEDRVSTKIIPSTEIAAAAAVATAAAAAKRTSASPPPTPKKKGKRQKLV